MASLNNLLKKVGRPVQIAYFGRSLGLRYEAAESGSTTKAIAESLKEILALYAAYSEVAEKFIKTLPFVPSDLSQDWLRIITSSLALFVSGHILFARKETDRNVYAYQKLPRRIAGVAVWLVIIALAQSLYSAIFSPPTTISTSYTTYRMPQAAWQAKRESGVPPNTRIYNAKITIPDEPGYEYKHIGVYIRPLSGFKLVDVAPESGSPSKPFKKEPSELGPFTPERSEWIITDFDPAVSWGYNVKVEKTDSAREFPSDAPLETLIFLYKD